MTLPEAGREVGPPVCDADPDLGGCLEGFAATLASAAGLGPSARVATRGISGRGSAGFDRAGRATQPSTVGVRWPVAPDSA